MSADRPINADVPEDDRVEESAPDSAPPEQPIAKPARPAESEAPPPPVAPPLAEPPPRKEPPASERPRDREAPPPAPKTRRRRRSIPGAIKLVAALVALAVAFIVLVVVAGGGGSKKDDSTTVTETAATPLAALPPAEGEGESDSGGGGEGGSAPAPSELAFPLVATDNTTRIGGATPAENAAAAALAVFPSTTAAQRPGAVVLVDEDDWAAAIAAAVLMAPPLRAPLLLSTADGLPPASEAALAALAPQGGDASKGASGFAFGDAAVPDDATGIESIRGGDGSAATAAAIAELRDKLFGSAPAGVVVAPLGAPEFAAPAAAYAARSGNPVLFAEKETLPKATAAALKRHNQVPVYVLGPSSTISDKVVSEIEKLGPRVTRVSGSDPVRNAIAFARFGGGSFGWGVDDPGHGFVLARSDSPLDAAAAAPLSAAGTWGPLLLTDSAATLPPELRNYFLDVKPGYTDNPTRAFYNHVWVVGNQEAIDVKQQAEVNELAELAKIGER